MNSAIKRLVTLALCAAMLTSALASCTDNEKKPSTVKVPSGTTSTDDDTPKFVDEKFDGETFTILSPMDDAADFSAVAYDFVLHFFPALERFFYKNLRRE